MLSDLEVNRLLKQQSITERQPWCTEAEQQVDAFYRLVIERVKQRAECLSLAEWDHYGSGYASYIEAFFYRDTPDFAVDQPLRYGNERKGLVVLLSRLSPYYVFMEYERRWHKHGGSSCLPDGTSVDVLTAPAVSQLALQVQPVLDAQGLIRLHAADLAEPLQPGIRVPTILGDPPYTRFDALFYWED